MTSNTVTDAAVDAADKGRRFRRSTRHRHSVPAASGLGNVGATVFVVPALLLLGAFVLFPALWSIFLGLTDYRLTGFAATRIHFIGLENFTSALRDPQYWNALRLSAIFVILSGTIGQSLFGFAVAWYLQGIGKRRSGLIETLLVVAWIVPSSVTVFIWLAVFDRNEGMLNAVLHTHAAWLIEYPMPCIIVFNIWVGIAFSVLQFRSALQSVPKAQLESARLMGAGAWRQISDVTFPYIRGQVVTNTLMVTMSTFNTFTPFMLTAGGPGDKSSIMPVYVYNTALGNGDLGMGSAISVTMLVVNLVLYLIIHRGGRRS